MKMMSACSFTRLSSLAHNLVSSSSFLSPFRNSSFLGVSSRALQHRILLYFLLILQQMVGGVWSARVEAVNVPEPGIAGQSAELECIWEKGDRDVYSVRWYMNSEQFYSYILSHRPEKVDHKLSGINVVLDTSDDRIVTLSKLTLESEGIYRCEVMTEAPFFQTSFKTANLTVVELPDDPQIYGVRDRYRVGDTINATCTAKNSRPAAVLSFRVNGKTVHPDSGRVREVGHAPGSRFGLVTTTSQLILPLSTRHEPTLTLTCEAHILSVKVQTALVTQVDPARSTILSFFNTGGVSHSTSKSHLILTTIMMLLLLCYPW